MIKSIRPPYIMPPFFNSFYLIYQINLLFKSAEQIKRIKKGLNLPL